ncbi:MAG: SDR family oxidoreductase [Muribaculaceae bacterium]|nr:SDR family oxidoreductase [Muribaculaceae bacterium]
MERFKGKVVVITGGAKGIGATIAERFRNEGAVVEIIDNIEGKWYVGDIADKSVLEDFASYVLKKHGKVDVLVNNAPPLMKGIDDCSWEEFLYSQKVGVVAPYYLSKLFKDYFPQGSSIINISSSRDRMSQPQTESYTAAKGGLTALTHALSMSLSSKARINSISPGWIDTQSFEVLEEDKIQHPVGRIGTPDDIASMVLFLCSDEAGFITGENIVIDGGMTHQMIYHGDHGWKLRK